MPNKVVPASSIAQRWGIVIAALVACAACGPKARLPDPQTALSDFAAAVQSGDADALHAMMTQASRRSLTRAQIARVLDEQRDELRAYAKRLANHGQLVSSTARLHYPDGEDITLDEKAGRFYVSAAAGLPAAARTPVEALVQLRAVLARRSFAGLMRVLSVDTREAIERDLSSLVEGLREPAALTIDVKGDRASVLVSGGHRVRLQRRDGFWRIEDFD
jgi:hypothetical protein